MLNNQVGNTIKYSIISQSANSEPTITTLSDRLKINPLSTFEQVKTINQTLMNLSDNIYSDTEIISKILTSECDGEIYPDSEGKTLNLQIEDKTTTTQIAILYIPTNNAIGINIAKTTTQPPGSGVTNGLVRLTYDEQNNQYIRFTVRNPNLDENFLIKFTDFQIIFPRKIITKDIMIRVKKE